MLVEASGSVTAWLAGQTEVVDVEVRGTEEKCGFGTPGTWAERAARSVARVGGGSCGLGSPLEPGEDVGKGFPAGEIGPAPGSP